MTTIFYSWQSDLPNGTNRTFIQQSLELALQAMGGDATIDEDPRIDRDTSGTPGSPDISATIFHKIDLASVFVADVSIINGDDGVRRTANPNVLLEVGYAKKTMGLECVVLVMNTAFGDPEDLPFHLRPRRVLTYRAEKAPSDRSAERLQLSKQLEAALRSIFSHRKSLVGTSSASRSSISQAIVAIDEGRPNEGKLAGIAVDDVLGRLKRLIPSDPTKAGQIDDDELLRVIGDTTSAVSDFAILAESAVTVGSARALKEIIRAIEKVAEWYNVPQGWSGTTYDASFDVAHFLGHEMFVVVAAIMIREERWSALEELLSTGFFLPNGPGFRSQKVSYFFLSKPVSLLVSRGSKTGRVSAHADLLRERHSNGELSKIVNEQQFMDADLFLFFRSVLPPDTPPAYPLWDAWSTIHLGNHIPRFLIEAMSQRYAVNLTAPLGVSDVTVMRERLNSRISLLSMSFPRGLFFPLDSFDLKQIGTQY